MGEQAMEGADDAAPREAQGAPRRLSRHRIGRRIGQLLLAALLVALLVWGAMFLRSFVLLPRTAQQEASDGYALMTEEFTRLAAADAELLDAEFGPVLGAERTLHCAVEPADSGWFTVDHLNQCILREIEVRAVPEEVTDPRPRAEAVLGDADAWQAEPGYLDLEEESCSLAAQARLAADEAIPVALPDISLAAVVVSEKGELDSCLADPGPGARALGSMTVQAPGSTLTEVPDGTRLLVVVREARISSSSLGCLPLPVFCEPAVSEPQLPAVLDR